MSCHRMFLASSREPAEQEPSTVTNPMILISLKSGSAIDPNLLMVWQLTTMSQQNSYSKTN